jgi:hypothetical protein
MIKNCLKAFRSLHACSLLAAAVLLFVFTSNADAGFNYLMNDGGNRQPNSISVYSANESTGGMSGYLSGLGYPPAGAVPTTTTVTSSANPSRFGQSVTFTATVSTAGLGIPTGSVQFFDGAFPIGGAVALNASGQAQVTTSSLLVSSHTISASYSGDVPNGFDASSGNLIGNPQVVNQANTTLGITSSGSNPSSTGQPRTFTATVNVVAPGSGTPTGTVTFRRNGSPVCSNVPLNGFSQAACTLTFTVAFTYNITATYSGSGNFTASNNNSTPYVQQVLGPTAAGVSIGGRVVSEIGRGLPYVTITMTDSDGVIRTAWTNTFGYYRFNDLPGGQTYVAAFSSRGRRTVTTTIMALDSINDLNTALIK